MLKLIDYERWIVECLRKKPLSQTLAVKIIKSARGRGLTLFAYPCPHCGSWHLTQNSGHPVTGANYTARGKKLRKMSPPYSTHSEDEDDEGNV